MTQVYVQFPFMVLIFGLTSEKAAARTGKNGVIKEWTELSYKYIKKGIHTMMMMMIKPQERINNTRRKSKKKTCRVEFVRLCQKKKKETRTRKVSFACLHARFIAHKKWVEAEIWNSKCICTTFKMSSERRTLYLMSFKGIGHDAVLTQQRLWLSSHRGAKDTNNVKWKFEERKERRIMKSAMK